MLASLGQECSKTVQTFVGGLSAEVRQGSLGRLRRLVRGKLRSQLDAIDGVVRAILE